MKPTIYAPFLSLVALAACNNLYSPSNTPLPPSFSVIRAQGDSLTVADTLNKFRAALGGSLNAPNSPPTDSGRREINWDGVPAALTNVDTFPATLDRKSTRLNSSHITISYAVFCLKKKNN